MKRLITGVLTFMIVLSLANIYGRQIVSTPQFRRSFLDKINQVRARGCDCGGIYMPPAPPLVWNEQLEVSAFAHANDMANQNYFSHTSRDGRTMQDRIRQAGYSYTNFKSYEVGENIAEGPQTIAEVMDGWLHSPGHCKNLMNPGFKEIGIGFNSGYWVQDFGGRVAFSADVQRKIKNGEYHIIEKQ
jgi:uncharacterized protein YkwD